MAATAAVAALEGLESYAQALVLRQLVGALDDLLRRDRDRSPGQLLDLVTDLATERALRYPGQVRPNGEPAP